MQPPYLEPFRIKAVEPIHFTTPEQRQEQIRAAGYNLFRIPAEHITIDLLTDSGTGAMSADQWAAMLNADESYAGSQSFTLFRDAVYDLTGYSEVLPVHQGRAAERIIFTELLTPGSISVSNSHFDTTRANVELRGAEAQDLLVDSTSGDPFGGNLDIDKTTELLAGPDGTRVRCIVLTITNNSAGGLAVSVDNVQAARKICDSYHIPLLLDASRFAENAYLIAERDPTRAGREPRAIAREVFDLADGAWASLKKDGFGNIGGILVLRDKDLADRCRNLLIATEGYSTYGGLAGRDLAALAKGLTEVTDIDYLRYRAQSTEWFGEQLASVGMPVVRPIGCHAVYIDAAQLLPHISRHEFPGQSLACEFYLAGAVRTCELGSLAFGTRDADGTELPAQREYVRLAVPRRVYTRNHFEYVIDAAVGIAKDPERISGMRILRQPPILRHFSAELEPATKCV